jgi:zinc and cadmium transporter
MNGAGMAAAVRAGFVARSAAPDGSSWLFLPGIALFAAIVLHKPADALAISVVLSRKGVSRTTIALVQLGFGITVAIGAMSFYFAAEHIETSLRSQLTGAALSISAGTLLFIALSDLLPEVQFHRHDRLLLFSALLIGVIFMGFIALLEPDDDEKPAVPAAQQAGEKPSQAN